MRIRLNRGIYGHAPGAEIEVCDNLAPVYVQYGVGVAIEDQANPEPTPFDRAPGWQSKWWPGFRSAGIVSIAAMARATPEQIDSVDAYGIGPVKAKALSDWARGMLVTSSRDRNA